MADAGDEQEHHEGHQHGHEHHDAHAHGNCEEALHDLYTYLDGELTDDRRSLIKGHLDDCNPCFEAFDFEAELRIVISHRCRDEVPDSLRNRIADQLASLEALCDPTTGALGSTAERQANRGASPTA